jgi:hypothetical protein
MKEIIKTNFNFLLLALFSFLSTTNNYSQVGCSVSFSTRKAVSTNLFYTNKGDGIYLGVSYQFNGQKNTVVRERKKTYGLTPTGDGDFFWLIDFGFSRAFAKVIVQPEISIGSKNYFTNYKDNRFKDNGYTLINKSETIAGIGINVGYLIKNSIEPYIGYHSLRKLTFGIRGLF